EGKTHQEAARQLGCPQGTLSVRLMRARTMLAKRVARQGLMISVGSMALLVAQNASSDVPVPLIGSALKSATALAAGKTLAGGVVSSGAAALTEGVLKAMFLTKLKFVTALCLAFGIAGAGVGMVASQPFQTAPKENNDAKARKDEVSIQGTWSVLNIEQVN